MEKILEVKNLKKHFEIKKEKGGPPLTLKAVDGVTFDVYKGETLGIVGESGCGKSTLGKTILNLHRKNAGEVLYNGVDISSLSDRELKEYRKKMQMIFQDPFSSLNPRKKISYILTQPMRIHRMGSAEKLESEVDRLMTEVGLDVNYKNRYPHQFSGGQRQRIGIARAFSLHPEFIICDEAVSALDVSVQAQILNLLIDLQAKYKFTYIFIAHDLAVVELISDRIIVMYLGRIVEIAQKKELITNRLHPYTIALFDAFPEMNPRNRREKKIVIGDVPSPVNPPSGCHFHPRCPFVMDICRAEYPELKETSPGHSVACWLCNKPSTKVE
ncbi:MAG TPA: ATP-binding cassette domain-containing protein [Spirochaetota bacterium]|nr:ATP-binding cassette domain-containing protein [Spirochaetota bacterium]HPS85536.1 ATP-binding cassette domain-containing protein [Spirochaetota bacterium]